MVAVYGTHADAYVVQGDRCTQVEQILVVGLLVAVQAGECTIVAIHHQAGVMALPYRTLGQSNRNGLCLRCLGDAEEFLGEGKVLHALACLVQEDEVSHMLGGNLGCRGQCLPLLAVGAVSCIGQQILVQGDVVKHDGSRQRHTHVLVHIQIAGLHAEAHLGTLCHSLCLEQGRVAYCHGGSDGGGVAEVSVDGTLLQV